MWPKQYKCGFCNGTRTALNTVKGIYIWCQDCEQFVKTFSESQESSNNFQCVAGTKQATKSQSDVCPDGKPYPQDSSLLCGQKPAVSLATPKKEKCDICGLEFERPLNYLLDINGSHKLCDDCWNKEMNKTHDFGELCQVPKKSAPVLRN